MSLGIGLAINNAKAVVEALLNQQSGFTRTPKTGVEGKRRGRRSSALPRREDAGCRWSSSPSASTSPARSGSRWTPAIYTSLPFLVLFQVGFLYVGMSSLFQGRLRTRPAPAQVTSAPV